MKNAVKIFSILLFAGFISFSVSGSNGPKDPAGKGNGNLGFGLGPGIPFYGGSGFGPAFVIRYDHGIWQAGPGTISLGGQFGTSFFWKDQHHQGVDDKESWTNIGFIFRAAYHYGWKVPGLDTYAGFGGGGIVSLYNDDDWNNGKDDTHVTGTPTAFIGASYFFNDFLGINGEVGYNFAYAQIGLNFRIVK